MKNPLELSTVTITVFTRHTSECPEKADRYWKRCNCRKALYIYEGGQDLIVSVKLRSWEQAERIATAQRLLRDPAEIERRRIQDDETAKKAAAEQAAIELSAAEQAKNTTLSDALDQWIAGLKTTGATNKAYLTIKKFVGRRNLPSGAYRLHGDR
jgi:hypothetical protein